MYDYFSLRITKDKMKAYLTVLYDNLNEAITVENILDYINSKGIIFGIRKEEIEKNVENKYIISNLLVARGEGLTGNKNDYIEYEYDIASSIIPQVNRDGFIELNAIRDPVFVHKGDLICSINIPTDKLKCKDIYGHNFILSADSFLPEFGSGVEYRYDESKVYAAIDGYINYEDKIIDVMPVTILKDNIGMGNYNGNVIIFTKINEGLSISTNGDVIIYGDIKNVNINAGGNIVVHGSIQDDGKCLIKAGKNIICSLISNINLYCGGSIYANRLTKCVAKAGRSIMVNGEGKIKSGRYTAGESVVANVLGSSSANELMINLWDNWYNIENNTGEDEKSQLFHCEEELSELRDQYMQLEKSLNTLKEMEYVDGRNANRANIIRHITVVRAQVMHSILEHKKKHEKISYKIRNKRMEIACSGEIYRGVQFRIEQAGYSVPDNTSNRVFYLNGEGVFLYRQYK